MTAERVVRLATAALLAAIVAGCVGNHLNKDPHQRVSIRYMHVANVHQLKARDGDIAPVGRADDGFWAVFDLCSLDVQGSNLKGFTYNANDFYVIEGGQRYDMQHPGRVTLPQGEQVGSQDSRVQEVVKRALSPGPEEEYLPRQTYPRLAYRLTIFFEKWPGTYSGQPMSLRSASPTVVMENITEGEPEQWYHFDPSGSGPIPSFCP